MAFTTRAVKEFAHSFNAERHDRVKEVKAMRKLYDLLNEHVARIRKGSWTTTCVPKDKHTAAYAYLELEKDLRDMYRLLDHSGLKELLGDVVNHRMPEMKRHWSMAGHSGVITHVQNIMRDVQGLLEQINESISRMPR